MASPFDNLDHMISLMVDETFGEAALISPRTSSQYAERKFDVNRREGAIVGVFSAGPAESKIKGNASGTEFQGVTRVGSTKSEFWLSAKQVQAIGFLPQRGDAVTLTCRSGSPVYSVVAVQHTDRGDVALVLVREDQSE